MRPMSRIVVGLAVAFVAVVACGPQGNVSLAPNDAGMDGGGIELGSTKQALETSLCGSVTTLQANSPWPMRGGCPTHAARSSEYGSLTNGKNWEKDTLGDVRGSAVIAADGSIYITGDDSFGLNGKLHKIEPSGTLKSLTLGGKTQTTPAIGSDGTVYVTSESKKLHAINPATFVQKWAFTAGGIISSSPAIGPTGVVYFGSSDSKVYAVKSTGLKHWTNPYTTGGAVVSSPALSVDGTIVFIGSDDTYLYALNSATGALRWRNKLPAAVKSSPAVGRFNRVYVGSGNTLYALDATKDAPIVWAKPLGSGTVNSPAVDASGVLYVGTSLALPAVGGSLYALTPDGSILWQYDVLGGVESTPTIDRAGNIFFGSNDSSLYALNPAGKLIWKYQTLGGIKSAPAITKTGAVIIGSDDNKIVSIGVGVPLVPNGGVCTSDAACEPGLLCGAGNGARFGKPAGSNVCWLPSCENKIKDATETEVDCGGPCGTCTNICSQSCAQGTPVTPPALETLSFLKGSFIRGSVATYQVGANKLALARGDQLRYEDRGDGHGRMALFEGARTNRIVWSEQLGHLPEWWSGVVTAPTMTLTEDATTSPDGTPTADRWVAAAAANGARAQTIINTMPTGSLSAWLRLTSAAAFNPASPLKTRAVMTDLTGGFYSEARDWILPAAWERRTLVTNPSTGSTAVQLSHKAGFPGSAALFPALPASDFAVWGWQLEEGKFPSSYIATSESAVTRRADQLVYETKDVPAWLRTGIWQFDFAPLFASAEIATTDEFVVVAWEGGQISLGKDAAGGALKITSGTTSVRQTIEWSRNTKLAVTVNTTAKSIGVRGATTGDGAVSYGTMAVGGTGRVGLGALLDGTKPAFGRLSELRKVASATVACVPDPDCVRCGDGLVTGTEVCDTALDGRCKRDCTKTNEPIELCDDDSECASGQVCGSTINASRFGLSTLSSVCWPAFCETNAAAGCGTTLSPCGICLCGPMCTGQSCGSTAGNGCDGECTGQCDVGAICTQNDDCQAGQVCGLNNGARFGQPAGTRVCWSSACEAGGGPGLNCGVVTCTPSCEDRTCGGDGCGGSCGTCAGICFAGYCLAGADFDPAPPPAGPLPPPLSPVPDADIDAVGTLPGSIAVGPLGDAEYNIPLEVPPAPGDMQPHLTLSYSSGRGNGLVGLGWSITGPELSVISRCPKISLDSGGAQPVVYAEGEKFCLDGSPLVYLGPLAATEYGANVVVREYRTKLDSFSRVAAVTRSGESYPSYWVVTKKDGTRLSYGRGSNAQMFHQTQVESNVDIISGWAVDKVEDRAGNWLLISYARGTLKSSGARVAGEILPSTIRYGNLLAPGTADHMVAFEYDESRKDSMTGYRGGRLFRRAQRLTKISTSVAHVRQGVTKTGVRTYWFDYSKIPNGQTADGDDGVARPITEPSRLTQIQVCAGSSSDRTKGCLPPTRFSYAIDREESDLRQGGFPTGVVVSPTVPRGGLLFDMNADGKADRVWAQAGTFNLDVGETPGDELNPQDGLAELLVLEQANQPAGASREEAIQVAGEDDPVAAADLDLDGLGDLVYPDSDGKRIVVLRSVGSTFNFASYATLNKPFTRRDWLTLDVDGDGYQDLFRCGASLGFLRNTGRGFEAERAIPAGASVGGQSGVLSCANQNGKGRPLTIDTDGDGVDNLLMNWVPSGSGSSHFVAVRFIKTAGAWSTVVVPTGLGRRMTGDPKETEKPSDVHPIVIDLNGDGLSDLLVARHLSDAAKPGVGWPNLCGSRDGCIGLQVWLNTGDPRTVFKNLGFLFSREQAQDAPEVSTDYSTSTGWHVTVPTDLLLNLESAVGIDYDGDGLQDLVVPGAPIWTSNRTDADDNPPDVSAYGWRVFRGFREFSEGDIPEYAHSCNLNIGSGGSHLARQVPASARVEFADFDGNGVIDVHVWQAEEGYVPTRWYGLGGAPERMNLERVTSGLGTIELFEYASGSGPHYTAVLDATCSYGTACFRRLPGPVVVRYSVRTPDAKIVRRFARSYRNLRADPVNRSGMGFAEVTVREMKPSGDVLATTVTEYDHRLVETQFGAMHPFASRPKTTWHVVRATDGDISKHPEYVSIRQVESTWELKTSDRGIPFVTLASLGEYSVAQASSERDTLLERAVTYVVDAYGNTTDTSTIWSDGAITAEHVDFDLASTRVNRWQTDLPKLVRQTFMRSISQTASYRRTMFEFDDKGLLFAVIREPFVLGDPGNQGFPGSWTFHGKRTEFARNPAQHNNVTDIREIGSRGEDRTTHFDWSTDSVVPDFVRDDLGNTTSMEVDRATGALLTQRAEDGVLTQWRRDVFGRPYDVVTPFGTSRVKREPKLYDTDPGGTQEPLVASGYLVSEDAPDGSKFVTVYNSLGMPTVRSAKGLKTAGMVHQELTYDFRGLLIAQARPHAGVTDTQGVIRIDRDDSGRVLAIRNPDGTGTAYSRARAAFLRSELSFVGPLQGETVEAELDARGGIRLARQAARGRTKAIFEYAAPSGDFIGGAKWLTTRYHYGNFDGLSRIEDPEQQVTEFSLDVYNRVTQRVDPASGTTTFQYSAFDQVVGTDDANGQHIAYGYDSLGRLTNRTGPDGSALWVWDCFGTASCKMEDVGKLAHTERAGVTTDYTYYPTTGLGAAATMTIAGEGSFATSAEYTSSGSLKTLRMDARNTQGTLDASYAVEYRYDASGGPEATSIRKVGTSSDLWSLVNTYESLAPASERYGNGIYRLTSYEAKTGRVQRLLDSPSASGTSPISDRFYTYDENGNVKTLGLPPSTPSLLTTYEYDPLDRLTKVSGSSPAENLTYDDAGNITSKQGVAYVYQDATRPCNPLSTTSCAGAYDTYRPHALRSAGTTTFQYDSNGNERLRTTGTTTLKTDYTDFNLPKLMTPNGSAAAAVSFGYNADGERVIKRAPGRTTIFMGDLYQRTVEGTATKHEFFVPLGSGAQLHVTRDAAGERVEYLMQDHLGSSRMIVSPTRQVVTRGFDSFGQATGAAVGVDQPGFTGHRQDADVGLVNMKGRTYDPKLGRFLQPDPIMGVPVGTGLNRYAYVLNNPMRYVDPTGLLAEEISLPTQHFDVSRCAVMGTCGVRMDGLAQAQRGIGQAEGRMDGMQARQPGGGPTSGPELTGGGLAPSSTNEGGWSIRFGNPPGATGPVDENGEQVIITGTPGGDVDDLVVLGAGKVVGKLAKVPVVRQAAQRVAKPVADVAVKALLRFFAKLTGNASSSRLLGIALEAAGHVRPPNSAAHHIVAGGAGAAARARAVLQKFGVGINDAVNGVFLPANKAVANEAGAAVHSTLHTDAYYETVNQMLSAATTRSEVEAVLAAIRQGLLSGGL